MSGGMAHGTRSNPREGIVLAIILIAIGIGALAMQANPEAGSWIVLIVGLGLLALFAFLREYGALVPGGIMTGLGAGIAVSETAAVTGDQTGGIIVLGLGLGFLSIWVIGGLAHIKEHHPWPLIPGGILTIVGVALLVGGAMEELLRYWPVVLIAGGLLVLWRTWSEMRRR